jgi:hypothetical protein
MKQVARFLIWLHFAGVLSAAQSVSYFPRVLTAGGTPTGLALSNPTSSTANVTLSFFGTDGMIVGTPASLVLVPGGQVARLATELFPDSNKARGWVKVDSDVVGLTGFYLNGDFVKTADGGDFVQPASSLTYPRVVETSTTSTEINITNPNDTVASVVLTLFDATGAQQDVETVNVPVKGQVNGTVSGLMGVESTAGGYLTAQASSSIFGTAVVSESNSDFSTLNAIGTPSVSTLIFPHIASGMDWATTLFLLNTGPGPEQVSLGLFFDDGTAGLTATVTVNPDQLYSTTVASLFGLDGSSLRIGWVRATASSAVLEGFQLFLSVTPKGVTALPAAKSSSTKLVQSHIAEQTSTVFKGSNLFTGLAVLNPSTSSTTATIRIIDTAGKLLAEKKQQIGSEKKVSLLLREIMPEALGETSGTVWVESTVPLHALQIFGTWDLGLLSQIPAQPISALSSPATPTADRFAISGKLSGPTGLTLGGIAVQSVGSSTEIVTTDYTGAFVIKNLASGSYTVQPRLTDFDFTPVSTVVSLSGNARTIDFTARPASGTTTPTVQAVSPEVVDVFVTSGTPVGGYQLTFTFDPSLVSLSADNVFGADAPFSDKPITINIDNVSGQVTLNTFQVGASPQGTLTVAGLRFTPKAVGTSSLTVTSTTVVDVEGEDLAAATVTLSPAAVTVTVQ